MAEPKDATDSGWGIIVVAATNICFLLTAGMTRCAGVLYTSWENEFEASAAMTGALASVVLACAHLISPVGAVVCRRLGARVTMILGGSMTSVSLLVSCFAQSIYQMYAVCAVAGFGSGLVFVAGLVVIATYFKKYYQAANGIASSGVGIGLVAFPPLLQCLLDTYGWRGVMLVVAGIIGNVCVGGALFRPLRRRLTRAGDQGEQQRLENGETLAMQQPCHDDNQEKTTPMKYRPLSSRRRGRCCACQTLVGLDIIRKNYCFTFFCLVNLQVTIPYLCYLVFIVPRASHIGISDQTVPLVLSAFGIASIFGRLLSGFLINWKFSSVKVFALAVFACGGGTLLTQLENYEGFVASSSMVGFFTGVMQSTTVVVVREYIGTEKLGLAMGVCYFAAGIGDLIGPVIAGRIFDITGSYPAVFYFLAGMFFFGFVQMICLPHLHKIQDQCCTSESSNDRRG